jgi:hypothetical protein
LSTRFDLRREARSFAEELTALLNGTVCHGIRLQSVLDRTDQLAWVGYKINNQDLAAREGIPLTLSKAASCYVDLSYQMKVDGFGQHLMVAKSYIGVYCDAGLTECLLHYDYERDKADGYPESHLQIHAQSPYWTSLLNRSSRTKDALEHLHLPTGGRRFRPSLEDIVEFLIVERVADARAGWSAVLNRSRNQFQHRQLRAAIRRFPDVAADQLREQGFAVNPPAAA